MSEAKELPGPEGLKNLGSFIADVRFAMLTTVAQDGTIDSRPMATQKKEFAGVLWFLTARDSRKVDEVAADEHVALMYADPRNQSYVTVKGRANLSRDKAKIHELWNPMYKAWFPGGEDDPQIRVLRVDVDEAEYWEASDSKIVRSLKYLAAAATRGAVDVGTHGTVSVR